MFDVFWGLRFPELMTVGKVQFQQMNILCWVCFVFHCLTIVFGMCLRAFPLLIFKEYIFMMASPVTTSDRSRSTRQAWRIL